ncbi:hypothetical protein B0O99DRAFT_500793 [Bisporella sp. PMI_857]|nr:hypothetical protein B0O99DRAFT_500793 [Bisporella sp. PMI_857]
MCIRSPISIYSYRVLRSLPKWGTKPSRSVPLFIQSKRHIHPRIRNSYKWQDPGPDESERPAEAEKVLYQGAETSESKLFAVGSSLATRLSTDRTLQCTEFDDKGNIVVGNQEIKKSDLVSKFGIQARDLRKIDDTHDFPAILVRQSTILVNFLQHRALITDKSVLVLHVGTARSEPSHDSAFMYGLQGKFNFGMSQHGTLPYEFRALETILVLVISELDVEYQEQKNPVNLVLEELDKSVDREKLKKLLDVSKQMSAFRQKVKLVRTALHTVLEADDDMAAMYLTEKASGKPRAEVDHAEVELLLENYYEASGEIVEKADKIISDVEYTHDSVRSILDSHRNSIMMLEVHFSVAMLSIATGTYVAGLYGMNLINGLEDAAYGFPFITGVSIAGIWVIGLWGLLRLRRIKRIYNLRGFQTKKFRG